jgi:hypothetical protein
MKLHLGSISYQQGESWLSLSVMAGTYPAMTVG